MPESQAIAPARHDATLDNFTDLVGCPCSHCAAIRSIGPATPGNPLAQVAERAGGDVAEATPAEARSRRYEMAEQRRKARRSVNQRAFLAHLRGAA